MRLTTSAFAPGGTIPGAFTADGKDQSRTSPGPGRRKGPAPSPSSWTIPTPPRASGPTGWSSTSLRKRGPRARPAPHPDPARGRPAGRQHLGRVGWNGPSPPSGKPHRYFFRIFALNAPLGLEPGASPSLVRAAMKDKVLAEGTLVGTYGR